MRFLLCLFTCCLLSISAWATHIVGGELNYRCLGNDEFEITLSVYRDCFNGVPYFDNPAAIGIFDANNQLIDTLLLQVNFQGIDDTITPVLPDPCFVIPPDACVHVTTYTAQVTLPFIPGGYQIAYQRCCRNNAILNIVNAEQTGATYYARIEEEALTGCSSNPVFINWPPVYICAGVPIEFDHSAIDFEGDSIVYKLCTPFDGGEFNDCGQPACGTGAQPCGPRPCPPADPVYQQVTWNPPYALNDVLGGIPLSIDPNTGLLTGTPNTTGRFVVGVCAEEYRNGQLIGTTRRDFQYNIGVCQLEIVSAFFAPDILCQNDLTVGFSNQSFGSNVYQWDFGDPNTILDISNDASPSYTYPDTGTYIVTLIAGPGAACTDTFQQVVTVQYESLAAGFDIGFEACSDTLTLEVIDQSTDSISQIISWEWLVNGISYSGQSPTIQLAGAGTYSISLTVTALNGCTETFTDTYTIDYPNFSLADTIIACAGDPVVLETGGTSQYEYSWSPAAGLSCTDCPNPIATPSQTTTYSVELTVFSIDTCVIEQSVTVVIPPPVEITAMPDEDGCDDFILLTSTGINTSGEIWSTNSTFTQIINPNQVQLAAGQNTFYVRGVDEFGCIDEDLVTIGYYPVELSISDTVLLCLGDTIQLMADDTGIPGATTFAWQPLDIILDQNGQEVTLLPMTSTSVTVEAENTYGCTDQASTFIDVSSTPTPLLIATADPDSIYPGELVQLEATQDSDYQYTWASTQTMSDPSIFNPTSNPLAESEFVVFVTDEYGCENQGIVRVIVKDFFCEEPYIFVPNAFTPNNDGNNDILFVRANAITNMYFAVYSRWGELVFESRDLSVGWDGTFKGEKLPPDVFAFYLEVDCLNGESFFKKGNVSILR